jgi:2-alkyl-3-oxoalkanoate reductase
VTSTKKDAIMRILVTGATGVLGRRVLPLLAEGGHAVTAVARGKEDQLQAAGATPVDVDLFDGPGVKDAVAGHDAVLDLATRIPPSTKMGRRSAWRDNDRLRGQASHVMADAVIATGCGRYVRESFVGVFADGGDAWVDEESPVDPTWPAATCLDAEAAAQRVTDNGGVGVALRFGMFYAADAAHTIDQVRLARRTGIAPFPGDPDGYVSHLHLDDAATAVVAALHAPAGVYVVAEDQPVTRRDAAAALGTALGRDLRLPPRFLSRRGPLAVLDRSVRLDASRFRRATGWAPKVPNVHDGWRQVVGSMT